MTKQMLAKDMKWPHCKESVVPENTWNTGLTEFMAVLSEAKDETWWCCDTELKYLTLRIDTRDNAFILYADGKGDNAKKVRVDPQRVVDAIDKWNMMYGDKSKKGRCDATD